MKCKEVQRQLTEDMTSGASAEVRQHLAGCRTCRELYQDLQSLEALSSELKGTASEAPAFFASRVCSQIGKNQPRMVCVRLAAVVGALVVVTVGIATLPGLYKSTARVDRFEPPAAIESEANQAPVSEVWSIDRQEPRTPRVEPAASPIVVWENFSSGYQLEMPATIEVRQTQAENEFYLRNVSH